MDDFEKYKEKYDADEQVVLGLFNKAIEVFEKNQYDLQYASQFIEDIENLEEGTKSHVKSFIDNKKYWRLVEPFPTLFRKYLIECFEQSCQFHYGLEERFFNQLLRLGDITVEILENVFNKYSDNGVWNQIFTTRGKTAEKLGKMGSKGIVFLLGSFKNGNENDKNCSLIGLRTALNMSSPSEYETIKKLIEDNLKSEYSSIRWHCFRILQKGKIVTLDEINFAFADTDFEIRQLAVRALFRMGIKQETAITLAVALEDSRKEVTDLVLRKLNFEKTQFYANDEDDTLDSIEIDELDQIISILIDELIVRSSGRPKEIFNSKNFASALEKLFIFNPQLQSKTLYRLCEIAYKHKGSTRNRATFVGNLIDKGEFAALVKEKVEDHPEDAKSILEIAGASLDTSSIVNRISETDPSDIQQNAANQIKLLEKYHEDGLKQAKTSFIWALILSILSLLCLMVTLYLLIISDSPNVINILTAVGTIFSQFLAGTQFYLYNQSRKQLTYYHQQMNQIQKFLLANSVAESLEGEAKEKSRTELVRLIATMDQVRDIPTKQ